MTKSTSTGTTKKATSMAELMKAHADNIKPLSKGDEVEGVVSKLTPQEILLDIGGKGLALVLEYDKKNLENLLSFLKQGEKVKATVLSPESEDGFPVVSLRKTLDGLVFSKFEKLQNSDKPITVQILDATRGGYFAQTPEGIRGFLPNSQTLDDEGALTNNEITVKIIEFDRDKKRIIFSQKALAYTIDPKEMEKHIKTGQQVELEVTSVSPYGIYGKISPKKDVTIEGFIHISEVSYDRIDSLVDLYKKGDTITVEILEIDGENRRVNCSIKSTEKDAFESIEDKYKKEQKVSGTVTSVKGRGVTFEIEKGINGFIPTAKISSGKTYKEGDQVEGEIVEFDTRRRVIVVSPLLKAIPIGYR